MQKLQPARLRRFLTQQELANQVGVDLNTIQRWESGESFPRPPHLRRLCDVLEVAADELIAADEWPVRKERAAVRPSASTKKD